MLSESIVKLRELRDRLGEDEIALHEDSLLVMNLLVKHRINIAWFGDGVNTYIQATVHDSVKEQCSDYKSNNHAFVATVLRALISMQNLEEGE